MGVELESRRRLKNESSVPAEHEERFWIFRCDLGAGIGNKIKKRYVEVRKHTHPREMCARNVEGRPRPLWYDARIHASSFSASSGCAPVQIPWPGTMTRWLRPNAEGFDDSVSTMLRGSEASRVAGLLYRKRRLSKSENVKSVSRRRALQLVRRAGARSRFAKERGGRVRIL
jgi:hypothetical protein